MNFRKTGIVVPLVVVNIIVFILGSILPQIFYIPLVLIPQKALIAPWTLLTHMFVHANFFHLFVNMYVLLMFGSLLEQRIGRKNFATIYFIAGLVAGIVSSIYYVTFRPDVSGLVGASGAIMGIMGVIVMLMPNLRVLFFFVIPMPLWIASIIFAIFDVFYMFADVPIAGIAHMGGMACGLAYGYYLKKKKKRYYRKFNSGMEMDPNDIDEYVRSGRI